jgi:hypothetical protein
MVELPKFLAWSVVSFPFTFSFRSHLDGQSQVAFLFQSLPLCIDLPLVRTL